MDLVHWGDKKGKIETGNHRFSDEIWDFPAIFPLINQLSLDLGVYIRSTKIFAIENHHLKDGKTIWLFLWGHVQELCLVGG